MPQDPSHDITLSYVIMVLRNQSVPNTSQNSRPTHLKDVELTQLEIEAMTFRTEAHIYITATRSVL